MVDGSVILEVEGAGLYNLQASLPPAARLLKGCNSSLYHCFFLPYDGNGLGGSVAVVRSGHNVEVLARQLLYLSGFD